MPEGWKNLYKTNATYFAGLSIWVETTLLENNNNDNNMKNLQAKSRKSERENMAERSKILGWQSKKRKQSYLLGLKLQNNHEAEPVAACRRMLPRKIQSKHEMHTHAG